MEQSYKLNTNYLKYLINEKYGSISNFANATQFSQESIYFWLREGKMPSNKLFYVADLLEVSDLKRLRKDFANE